MKQRAWRLFLLGSLVVGLFLRLIWLSDMEWKEDEHYNFIVTQLVGRSDPWPWWGMPSGVFIRNPGMSVWVFVWLARLTGAETPLGLMRALATLSMFGVALVAFFAWRRIQHQQDREPWLWATALASVNPLLVAVHRKLWPEPFFALLTPLMILGWWSRKRFLGAACWGLVGACLGQVHMSGFFMAAALALWTALRASERRQVHWKGWLLGSLLGAIPLAPWAMHVLTNPTGESSLAGLGEALQLKFWVFWISDPLGLHLGNLLGLHLGPRHWDQLSDFARWPLLGSSPTYLVGVAHVLMVGLAVFLLARQIRRVVKSRAFDFKKHLKSSLLPKDSTGLLIASALWGFGALMTVLGVRIRRYYMMVSFPLEGVWLARWALADLRFGRRTLAVLWALQLLISLCFVVYVHHNGGSLAGDYGPSFERVMEQHIRLTGKPWPERPPMVPLVEPQR